MRKYSVTRAAAGGLLVLALTAAASVQAVQTVVIDEDFNTTAVGSVPPNWVSVGGTALFQPGADDYRFTYYGYAGENTFALTNPFFEPAGMVGAIYYDQPIDIVNNKLLVEMDIMISPGTISPAADGMTFMIIPRIPAAPGTGGGGMGWNGLGGFCVGFDIWDNGANDPDPDPVILAVNNGACCPARFVGVALASQNPTATDAPVYWATVNYNSTQPDNNIPDFVIDETLSVPVHVEIVYDNGHLEVYMQCDYDGQGQSFARKKVLDTVINPWVFHSSCPDPVAYVGFSGSTGGNNALQEADNLKVTLDSNIGPAAIDPAIPPPSAPPALTSAPVGPPGSANTPGWNAKTYAANTANGCDLGGTSEAWAPHADYEQHGVKLMWAIDTQPMVGSETPQVINYDQNADPVGLFGGDALFPGLAAGDPNNFAGEYTGFMDLAAGAYSIGVNSDDGFLCWIGDQFMGSATWRGTVNTVMPFSVTVPGVYPIRVLFLEAGGGANVEVVEVDVCTGDKLVGDPAGRIKVFQNGPVPMPPAPNPPWVEAIDPATKVGEVGQGSVSGWTVEMADVDSNVWQLNQWTDAVNAIASHWPAGIYPVLGRWTVGSPVIDYPYASNWPDGSAADVNEDFAVRAYGFIELPAAGRYSLFVASDDGFRAAVGGQTLKIAGNKGRSDMEMSFSVSQPGLYPIDVVFYERGGGDNFTVFHYSPDARRVVTGPADASGVQVWREAPGAANAVWPWYPALFELGAPVAPLGACEEPGFDNRSVKSADGGQPDNLAQTELLLAGGIPVTFDVTVPWTEALDFWDSGGKGHFGDGWGYPVIDTTGLTVAAADPDNLEGDGDDRFAIEATGFLALPAGDHVFAVNSDDGFSLDIGGAHVAEWWWGRGTSDTFGMVRVPAPGGYYPFRLSHWEGGGGAAVELLTWETGGIWHRVNDQVDAAAIQACRVVGGGAEEIEITSIVRAANDVTITWTATGAGPFQVQTKPDMAGAWTNVGPSTMANTATIPADSVAKFIQVVK